MQTYKKILLVAAATLAFTTSAFAETLKMGIEAAYPPFNNKDASGQVVGFDYEIGQALCAKLKAECQAVTSDWDGIIPALEAKKFDFLISSMSITDERKQAVDFTDPYYSNKLQFIAPKTTSFDADTADQAKQSIKGKYIGAQRATLSGIWLEDQQLEMPDVNVKLYDTQENAFLDLSSGRVDAMLAGKYVGYEWLKARRARTSSSKVIPSRMMTRSVSLCARTTRCVSA